MSDEQQHVNVFVCMASRGVFGIGGCVMALSEFLAQRISGRMSLLRMRRCFAYCYTIICGVYPYSEKAGNVLSGGARGGLDNTSPQKSQKVRCLSSDAGTGLHKSYLRIITILYAPVPSGRRVIIKLDPRKSLGRGNLAPRSPAQSTQYGY